jgi:hypothetical protein
MLEAWRLEEYSLLVVMTITLAFLDKYGISLHKCHTQDGIPTKPNTLLHIKTPFYYNIEMSSTSPDLYEPKSGLLVTISLELLDVDETQLAKQWPQ